MSRRRTGRRRGCGPSWWAASAFPREKSPALPPRATSRAGGPGSSVVLTGLLLGLLQQLLELFVCLGDDIRRLGPLDGLLDGHADDVAVLRDVYDLGQAGPSDFQALQVRGVPVGRQLGLGLHLGIVPG